MNFTISNKALVLYQKEMQLQEQDTLMFFVRVGGIGSGGFSVGVTKEKPDTPHYTFHQSGITFYITEEDAWYFDGMTIDFDEDLGQMIFENPSIEDVTNPNPHSKGT
ncbi:HesB/YadR/YfhF family protein [Evansella tamaricis]|uniref:Core domain-containing protein n=1 Tax=Evansella tamaricis TaxID=2069301 RepID=A0ABS6JMV0_9BACI|nr:iron-sulfur cluster biosynthesis family protein [Evansella tamaricis]MBU9714858.1 hypothetical protein [Evansella tamaricis]